MLTKQKEEAVQKTKEELMDGTQTPGSGCNGGNDEKSTAEKIAQKLYSGKKENNDILSHYVGGN